MVYLGQPIALYPNLEGRSEFGQLGAILRERVPNLFFGGDLPIEHLNPDHIDELGRTLHFKQSTYRTMLRNVFDQGLDLPGWDAAAFEGITPDSRACRQLSQMVTAAR